eukprot:CAMPEP_0181344268 /NCGR_PEP_ID=MMETSP1101-20121128/32084_1 /TAXON_ID=46948 /ORGANISM="Rhodomonas abbreviata, Strain Caron Lab Isolate" /LENGTH=448 /DNA_ID=CAMNT_0023456063 /DNA_START=107 /DNA_END=1450 /DNA_ORIENTATION=-
MTDAAPKTDVETETKKPQNARKQNNGERRPRDDDNAPLVKPTPVPDPDEGGHQERTAKIKEEIDAGEKKVAMINDEVFKYKEQRSDHDVLINVVKDELRVCREKSRECFKQRDAIVEDLKRMTEVIKNQNLKAERLRKDLKYTDLDEIDRRVEELHKQQQTTTMDLKAEKDIVRDIKRLTADKEKVKEWEREREAIQAKRAAHDELFAARQAKGDEVTLIKEEEKEIVAALRGMRAGEGTPEGVNPSQRVKELLDEKAQVIETIKAARAALKEAHGEYRNKTSAYREYQRALQAYERRVERSEYARRREEQRERNEQMKEERKERDRQRKEAQKQQEQRMAAVAAGCQLFVGGLALRCSEFDLEAHFLKYGEVTDTAVVTDKEAHLSRGFGFVTFKTKEEAQVAVKECNNREIQGLCTLHGRLKVKMAEKSKQQKEWEAKHAKRVAQR